MLELRDKVIGLERLELLRMRRTTGWMFIVELLKHARLYRNVDSPLLLGSQISCTRLMRDGHL